MVTSRPLSVQQLSQLTDANLSGLADNDLLAYDSGSSKWTNQTAAAAGVAAASHNHDHGALTGLGDDDHTIYVKADGTRALSGHWSAGGFRITTLGTPSSSGDAATKGYVDGLLQGLDLKASVRVATTGSGTMATGFENGDTIDGVVLETGNRILIKDQGSSDNGIYIVNASGAPTRATDMAAAATVAGAYCFVEEGTVNGDKGFVCTNNAGSDIVGTSTLVFTQFNGAGGVSVLDDLSDVVITSAASGQFLRNNGSNWINVALVAADLPAMVGDSGTGGTKGAVPAPAAGDAAAAKFLKADGTWAVPAGGSGSSHFHDPVRCVTTANVSISGGGIANGTTHDGITVSTGNRILVAAQSSAAENGIYVVPSSGAASRATDMAAGANASSDEVNIQSGALYADYKAIITSNSSTVGTDPLTIALVNMGASNVTANYFVGGPESGSPAPPSPRKIVPADYSHNPLLNHNLLINPGMEICQRVIDPTVGWSVTDNSYGVADRFKLLSSGSTVESSRATGTTAKRLVLKNDTGSSNRFGAIQVVSAANSRPYRSETLIAFAHLLCSQTKNARIALLEWTGTEDAPTTDVVNSWSNGTFTAGNFFLSSNLTVVGTAQVALTANTLTQVSISGAVSASCKNLIWMVWTEDTISSNATFEIEQPGLYLGNKVVNWKPLKWELDEVMCLPYCEAIDLNTAADYGTGFNSSANQRRTHFFGFRARKRVIPTGYHNITGFSATAPGSKQIGIYDFVLAAQQTISGALTMGITAFSAFRWLISAAAGTSFPSGGLGNPMSIQFGTDVVIYFDADF